MTQKSATPNDPHAIRAEVQRHYGAIAESAETGGGCCGPATGCGPGPSISLALGYDADDLEGVPEGANLGLGCGNPQAIASLKEGERVLDLGSGGGFDCLLAAQQVGPEATVIGVDMTPSMIDKARANATQARERQTSNFGSARSSISR